MPLPSPATRGILRRSSYKSSLDENSDHERCDEGSDSPVPLSPTSAPSDTSPTTKAYRVQHGHISTSHPVKPQRRNVGKVERPTRDSTKVSTRENPGRSISFSDKVDEREIPIIPPGKSSDFFYDEEEIAHFRHEKFMEEAGLDPDTYEPIPLW